VILILGTPDNVLDEVEKKIAEKMGFRATSDDRFKLLEMNVDLDLDGYEHKDKKGEKTGIALPYVSPLKKEPATCWPFVATGSLMMKPTQNASTSSIMDTFPGFGFYCFGLIHLIGAFAKSGTSLIRQLVDAGTLSNCPAVLKLAACGSRETTHRLLRASGAMQMWPAAH
jgi:hypothetical protein